MRVWKSKRCCWGLAEAVSGGSWDADRLGEAAAGVKGDKCCASTISHASEVWVVYVMVTIEFGFGSFIELAHPQRTFAHVWNSSRGSAVSLGRNPWKLVDEVEPFTSCVVIRTQELVLP